MKHFLTPENRNVLLQFALSNVLLMFDYDGTLAPIVEDRNNAPMRPKTLALLAKVCRVYPCAVLSGRSRADVLAYLKGISVQYVVGNHGLEPTEGMERFKRRVSLIRAELEPLLAQIQGVEIEDKEYSLAIHYRRSRQRLLAREEVIRAVAALRIPVRTIRGKLVFNILPKSAPNKGIALQTLRERQLADTALYVGDDVTDEDVFQLDEPGRLLSIRVGRSSRSAAQFYVRSQAEIDDVLTCLVHARRKDGHS